MSTDKASHTPAPLEVGDWQTNHCTESDGLKAGFTHRAVVDASGRAIALLGLVGDRSDGEALANGHLFSAAPDMLKALKRIVAFWDVTVPADCIEGMHLSARAAIAKAEQP